VAPHLKYSPIGQRRQNIAVFFVDKKEDHKNQRQDEETHNDTEANIVHHIDGNKQNNTPENLQITFQSQHVRGHIKMMLTQRKIKAGF
jgi:hypothetical protein